VPAIGVACAWWKYSSAPHEGAGRDPNQLGVELPGELVVQSRVLRGGLDRQRARDVGERLGPRAAGERRASRVRGGAGHERGPRGPLGSSGRLLGRLGRHGAESGLVEIRVGKSCGELLRSVMRGAPLRQPNTGPIGPHVPAEPFGQPEAARPPAGGLVRGGCRGHGDRPCHFRPVPGQRRMWGAAPMPRRFGAARLEGAGPVTVPDGRPKAFGEDTGRPARTRSRCTGPDLRPASPTNLRGAAVIPRPPSSRRSRTGARTTRCWMSTRGHPRAWCSRPTRPVCRRRWSGRTGQWCGRSPGSRTSTSDSPTRSRSGAGVVRRDGAGAVRRPAARRRVRGGAGGEHGVRGGARDRGGRRRGDPDRQAVGQRRRVRAGFLVETGAVRGGRRGPRRRGGVGGRYLGQLFRAGDLARWNGSGVLELVGRAGVAAG
jgi:hypothetical protein